MHRRASAWRTLRPFTFLLLLLGSQRSDATELPECAPQYMVAQLYAQEAHCPVPFSPPHSCALLVFRHVQKTGGSTLRHFFRRQELSGDWEFYGPQGDGSWPETTNRVRTRVLLDFWEAMMSPTLNFTETPRRVILEWHAEAHVVPPWEHAVEARV
jgi:hypothetical protein